MDLMGFRSSLICPARSMLSLVHLQEYLCMPSLVRSNLALPDECVQLRSLLLVELHDVQLLGHPFLPAAADEMPLQVSSA
jgi:hypothetical protein